jgi:hypothetical protein
LGSDIEIDPLALEYRTGPMSAFVEECDKDFYVARISWKSGDEWYFYRMALPLEWKAGFLKVFGDDVLHKEYK